MAWAEADMDNYGTTATETIDQKLMQPVGFVAFQFQDEDARPAPETKSLPADLPDDNPKTRFGVQKPAMSAVPPSALVHLMKAMADGRRKYGLMNWREKNVSSSIYYDAAMRHLMSWYDGEEIASDSKVHHLGHAMACLAIILDAEACGTLNDDRPTPGAFTELVSQMTAKL